MKKRAGSKKSPWLVAMTACAWSLTATGTVRGIYINPQPNNSGLAQNIADNVRTYAGIVGDNTSGTPQNAFCSGELIQSSVIRGDGNGRSFATTAGHCITMTDLNGRFWPTGASGVVRSSEIVRRHPGFPGAGTVGNDVGLFRMNTVVANVTHLPVQRTPALGNINVWEVGFGNTEAGGGGFSTKREAQFTINNTIPNNPTPVGPNYAGGQQNAAYMNTPGNGTMANPTRHSCAGDSGGPYTLTNTDILVGIHDGGNGGCTGAQTQQWITNVTSPYIHNWMDSYTEKGIFWDRLTINGTLVDGFEFAAANVGMNGTAPGWATANDNSIAHPNYGAIGPNTGWRYISSIGQDNGNNPELYVDDDPGAAGQQGSQGQGEVMTTGGPSLIRRAIPVQGGGIVAVGVQQRWNSLGLQDDVAVCVVGGGGACVANTLVWNGLATSTGGNLDQWFPRTQAIDLTNFPGNQMIAVYLLNVPEPVSLSLLAFGAVVCFRRSRRR